jgi:membrane dipeptidase
LRLQSVAEARQFHGAVPVVDLHADTPKLMVHTGYDLHQRHGHPVPSRVNYAGHVDLPRLREGGVAAQVFGLWTFPYPERGCARAIHRQLDSLARAANAKPGAIAMARSADDIRACHKRGTVAALSGIEGGHALEGDLRNLERFGKRGVAYLGRVHFTPNAIGRPQKSFGPAVGLPGHRDDGLTRFGHAVVEELNRQNILVDLSHINRQGFYDAVDNNRGPIMVSHTGVAGVHAHWRHIDDDQLRAIANAGGCVGIMFSRRFLGGPGLDALCAHILHVIEVAGAECPALGSDFDGFVVPPRGLEDVSLLPALTLALSQRGLGERALRGILGGNAMRVLGATSRTSD